MYLLQLRKTTMTIDAQGRKTGDHDELITMATYLPLAEAVELLGTYKRLLCEKQGPQFYMIYLLGVQQIDHVGEYVLDDVYVSVLERKHADLQDYVAPGAENAASLMQAVGLKK